MITLTFCRTCILGFIVSLSIGCANDFSHPIPAFESKCPSGGCYESPPIEAHYPLLVFISLSMPDAALLSFSSELEIYGGAFVIRGLPNNSFAEFFQKLNHLKTLGLNAPILIDPDSFNEHNITAVPTIVLKEEKISDHIVGNVPISYALETFANQGELPTLAKELKTKSRLSQRGYQ
ncbi:type-F conjugative transfer system pilin assembly protein TrbC [Candidatus Neptunochlamydia vexilliferae]|uniref:Type-F conjugative transfer system pilin assembly protein TrbC n=1 Tax=Candidatus Neptunichlamydia vexilliferae TaxID=1651774 RepID=A0ABS0AYM2_9BACT|nr:type-F conjugative transfer system pilin assembly protein TrbC [Candidatus Neptunochlamydia vexilliferae]MBF5059064.1 hypothetical protein [Candidatus Neptunochlamydia vexilliferae]